MLTPRWRTLEWLGGLLAGRLQVLVGGYVPHRQLAVPWFSLWYCRERCLLLVSVGRLAVTAMFDSGTAMHKQRRYGCIMAVAVSSSGVAVAAVVGWQLTSSWCVVCSQCTKLLGWIDR